MTDRVLATIGYERHTLDSFVRLLVEQHIDRIVDVRELPLSRRKGFSKTPLREALAVVGIEYLHLREAGNPYREAKRDIDRCLALYRKHISETPAAVDMVQRAVVGRRAALLCVEADCQLCHRSILVEKLRERSPEWRIMNL